MEKNRYNLEEVMPRLSLLSQVLEELDIENELIVSLEREPEILAVLEERRVRIQAEMTEGHKALMVMRCEIELPETGVGNMELMCQRFNQRSLFGTAVWEPIKNQMIFRSIVYWSRTWKQRKLILSSCWSYFQKALGCLRKA